MNNDSISIDPVSLGEFFDHILIESEANVQVSYTYTWPEKPARKPVKIGPILYDVKEIEGLADEDTTLNGWIKYDSCEILIEAGLPDQVKHVTLWYEILHGILNQASQVYNEELVEALAYGLVAVFQDNPGLADQG